MKNFLSLCIIGLIIITVSAQTSETDSLKNLLAATKEDTVRVKVLAALSLYEPSFQYGLSLAQKGLALAKKTNYRKGEALCLNQIGNQYAVVSNYPLALQYYLQGLQIREEIHDSSGIAVSSDNIGFVYRKLGDYTRAQSYFMRALQIQSASKDNYGLAITCADIGTFYEQVNKLDSALTYYQRSYECFNRSQEKYQMVLALNGLGSVQHKLGNKELAFEYYKLGINNSIKYSDSLNLPESLLGMAILFKDISQTDSSILYAKNALNYAQQSNVQDVVIQASRLLSQLYQNRNDKEALKYLSIAIETSDSTFSKEKSLQVQNLSFLEQERQKQMIQSRKKAAETRRHNLQYSAIGIFIMCFIILFLLLSHSIIASPKLIRFFGVVALLIFFEFFNLLLHPYLGELLHHSPLPMFLSMVCIAGLLVPLHHKLEHWITHQLVEKNNRIKLKAAKRTIEQLEGKDNNILADDIDAQQKASRNGS